LRRRWPPRRPKGNALPKKRKSAGNENTNITIAATDQEIATERGTEIEIGIGTGIRTDITDLGRTVMTKTMKVTVESAQNIHATTVAPRRNRDIVTGTGIGPGTGQENETAIGITDTAEEMPRIQSAPTPRRICPCPTMRKLPMRVQLHLSRGTRG